MEYTLQFPKLCQRKRGKWLFMVALVAVIHFFFLPIHLPNGDLQAQDRYAFQDITSSTLVITQDPLKANSTNVLLLKNSQNLNVKEFTEFQGKGKKIIIDVTESEGEVLESIGWQEGDIFRDNNSETNGGFTLQQQLKSESGCVTEKNASTSTISTQQIKFPTSANKLTFWGDSGGKETRIFEPPKSVTSVYEMNRILEENHQHPPPMRGKGTSVHDQELLAVRSKIENAPLAVHDEELYAPAFRNISMFKRSYELMEITLKVYIYRDGKKPVFHQPILKGIYASEGWFMKLMEANKHYVVKNPRKAHLFYMPFSSRMLERTLYRGDYNNRTNLRQFLQNYSEKIAARYPYWKRTRGADHFLVACHDWAPYETRHHMDNCIKALCTSDVNEGFKIGRDVSIPQTSVRSKLNPLRDLGGKPPSQRHILAFFVGSMHGYLRPIMLEHWKGKDPKIKISGPMPKGFESKMNYIEHMKSSKYCICPKGHEVNSPRVVEAIFYECVPVIISDNFVPPFFEVLNWNAFSVTIAEKDIPNLKIILLSIPEEKYLEMQLGVRKVQKHFLWHTNATKYDLFHMILHSIWYNRVFQAN